MLFNIPNEQIWKYANQKFNTGNMFFISINVILGHLIYKYNAKPQPTNKPYYTISVNFNTENFYALKRYESNEVDRRTWLHVSSRTPWSDSSDTHQAVEI